LYDLYEVSYDTYSYRIITNLPPYYLPTRTVFLPYHRTIHIVYHRILTTMYANDIIKEIPICNQIQTSN